MRPDELAHDHTPGTEPVLHAVDWLDTREGYRPDFVIVLQPTSPLRLAEDIEAAIDLAISQRADSVVSICEVRHHPFHTVKRNKNGTLTSFFGLEWQELQDKYPRRQDCPLAFAENGAIYLIERSSLLRHESLYGERLCGYVMPTKRSLDIDTPWDLYLADLILKARNSYERN
jgi:N-acylneuraminate cytidylyltransferase/CMP-N,N'-diacetyllegionaminic acid synthase